MTNSAERVVKSAAGMFTQYLCIDNILGQNRVYVHELGSGSFVVTKHFSPGLDHWLVINHKDKFSSIQEINQAIQEEYKA